MVTTDRVLGRLLHGKLLFFSTRKRLSRKSLSRKKLPKKRQGYGVC